MYSLINFDSRSSSNLQHRPARGFTRARLSSRTVPTVATLVLALFGTAANADIIDDLQPGHWAAVSLNRISDVDPCPANNCSYTAVEGQSAVIDDWNGGAFATGYGSRGGLVVYGGGHKGYFGNEIYVFDLATRMWVRVTDPVVNPICNQSTGELQDGSPCSAHTYDYVDYHPTTNSFVRLGSSSNHEVGGGGSPKVHLFSFDQVAWRGGASSDYPVFEGHAGASSAYDPNRDVFWLLPAYNRQFMKYDPNANGGSGRWTPYSIYNIEIDAVSAIDPDRDLFVTLDTRGTERVIVHDLSNPGATGVTVTTTGDTGMQSFPKPGFEWDPVVNKFVVWGSGSSVYTLVPPANNWANDTWVWQRVDAAPTNSVTPSARNSNGTYSRFRYAPSVNAYVVINSTTDSVYMYRLSDGATVPVPPSVNLTANPAAITAGQSATLSWSSSGADSCAASGGWSGSRSLSGTFVVSNLQSTTNYSLTCANSTGSTTRTATVTVNASTPGGSDADADWAVRSSAPGVLMATRFDTIAEVQQGTFPDSTADHVIWDQSNKASGGGSLRMDILKTDSTSSGSWVRYLSDDQREFGPNQTFYVQFRQYVPAYLASHVFSGNQFGGSYGGGWKQAIISNNRGSNQLFEVVLQNTSQRGLVQGYNRNSNGDYSGWEESISTPCSSSDFVFQNRIDGGGPETTCLESRRKRGGLYSYGANTGSPDPETAAFSFYPDEWLTFLVKISPGTFGAGSSIRDTNIQVWATRETDTDYTMLIDKMVNLGAEADSSGSRYYFDAIWLLPYHTNRTPDLSRSDTFTLYDEVIVSTQFIAAPSASGTNSGVRPEAPSSLLAQ